MADPLARDEDRHRTVEVELHELEWARMLVAPEVPNQTSIITSSLGPMPVAGPRAGGDSMVSPHVVHQGNEPMVKNWEVIAQKGFSGLRSWTFSLCHGVSFRIWWGSLTYRSLPYR